MTPEKPLIECSACLAYRSLPHGHPYAIKYPAVTSFHTDQTPADSPEPCHVTNLCEYHSPSHDPTVRTAPPGEPCHLGDNCAISTPAPP